MLSATTVNADWKLNIESGLAFSGYNDVRIPGNSGTKLSLSEDLQTKETEYLRVRYTVKLGERHYLSALYAPLQFTSSGVVNKDVLFNGVQFDSGSNLNSLYRFDSYRISYQYSLFQNNKTSGKIGFTGKIRDAAIRIENGTNISEKANTGFVPLIYFAFAWQWSEKAGLLIEGDALAAPQGRAEDVLLATYRNISDNFQLRLGYRILEGGADNDEVYTFALVNYLSMGLTLKL